MATVTCARCGRENPEGAKFCLECGNALAAISAREERKVVSVLFADLVGFTERSDKADPEEVRALLAPYHAMLRSELQDHGGTVEKFIGDAVMALFGAPIAHEDDPERAVRAALAIRDTLVAEGRLHVRIGVTTGEALIALDARPESGEGMASGDVVNTASRLQSAAPTDGILVDESTFRATSRVIDYRDHEAVVAKGKAEPVHVHEAVAARSRFGVDVRQVGLVPLVGRGRELDMLFDALARAIDERQPQLVTVVGVPGIGKSRLVWELFQRVDAGDRLVAWRQGRSLPYAESISYWALGEMVKAEAGILDTDAPEEAAAKLTAAVSAVVDHTSDAEWIERHLAPLVGLKVGREMRGDHRGEAFAAWRRYLEALADKRPLVLVFEDLHWADDGLLDFIDSLFDWATDVPLLIMGTSRPELLTRRPGWGGGKPNALTVSLSPLTEAETGSLVGALVEQAVMPVSVREAVLERAQGNPLYAEEFARLLAAGGHIEELPETVQGIIAARLDGLGPQKELLQGAAVVGKVFWSGAVATMVGSNRFDVDERFHSLERAEFVRRERRSSVAGETEYAFRHILIRDVAYGQIPRARRAEQHVAAARWLESLGRPADYAELLAQHYLAAIELDVAAGRATDSYAQPARDALVDAGDHALALNSFATAARYYRSALDLIPIDDSVRPVLLFNYGKAARVSEEAGDDELAEAERGLLAAGDFATAAEAAVLRGELAWYRGDGDAASAHLGRAEELVDDLSPSYSKAFVLADLARYRALRGEHKRAIERGRQALELAEQLGLEEVQAHALDNIGIARTGLGDLGGVADLERAVEIARRINSAELARALNNLAVQLDIGGETKRAWAMYEDALLVARKLGNKPLERFIENTLPFTHYAQGKWDIALAETTAFLSEAERTGGHAVESDVRGIRSRILLARGDNQAALDDAYQSIAGARRAGDPPVIVAALCNAAWLLTILGRRTEAEPLVDELAGIHNQGAFFLLEGVLALVAHGRQADVLRIAGEMTAGTWNDVFTSLAVGRTADAIAMLEPQGYRPQPAILRLVAAREMVARGEQAEAREVLAPAIDFWMEVGATHWLGEAERLLGPATKNKAKTVSS